MKEMTLQEVQQVSLEILKDVHEFCVNNDIKYSLSGGSLLGAIRHNGFIPWDDDIDIQMPRPEYEKFIHSYKSERGYRLFSREVEGCEDVGIAFTKICDVERTYVNTGIQPWKKDPTGIWIDVFPIDGAPRDFKKAKRKIMKMFLLWRLTVYPRMRYKVDYSISKGFFLILRQRIRKLLSPFFPASLILYYIKQCKEYDYNESEYVANLSIMQYRMKEWQLKEEMADFVLHSFEEEDFYIMKNYEISLSSLYGDYMKLPPEEKRTRHSNYIYYWK